MGERMRGTTRILLAGALAVGFGLGRLSVRDVAPEVVVGATAPTPFLM